MNHSLKWHGLSAMLCIVLTGCGGADSGSSISTIGIGTASVLKPTVRRLDAGYGVLTETASPYGGAELADAARQLMDFGESKYPEYFPGHKSTLRSDPFLYRYYPDTKIYLGVALGVAISDGYVEGGVYVMGGEFGNAPVLVGHLLDFIVPIASAPQLSLLAGTAISPGSKEGITLTATFNASGALTEDRSGNVYVVDGCKGVFFDSHALIRKISPDGTVTNLFGSPSYLGSGPDGISNRKCFTSIVAHPDGNLYVIDSINYVVEKVTPQGIATLVAGMAGSPGSTDGQRSAARFQGNGLNVDAIGNLIVADTANHTIRKIDEVGNVTTLTGKPALRGSIDADLQTSTFNEPSTLKSDKSGAIYVGDHNGIRRISNGSVTTVISQSKLMQEICGSVLGDMTPSALDVSSDGRIAVAYENCRSAGIYSNGKLEVLFNSSHATNDKDGAPSDSNFFFPAGVLFTSNGDLLISDRGNNNIKRYSASSGLVTLFAGQRNLLGIADGPFGKSEMSYGRCPVTSPTGEIWFSQQMSSLRKLSANKDIKTVLNLSFGACPIAYRSDGSLIIVSHFSGDVGRYSQDGQLLEVIASALPFTGTSYAINQSNEVFFGDKDGYISKYSKGVVSRFSDIQIGRNIVSAVALDPSGGLVVAGTCTVFRISSSGMTKLLAGIGGSSCNDTARDGIAELSRFGVIGGLAASASGAVYVSDRGDSTIRMISNGVVSTIAGTRGVNETTIGPLPGGIFDPFDLAVDDEKGRLIVTTTNSILQIELK